MTSCSSNNHKYLYGNRGHRHQCVHHCIRTTDVLMILNGIMDHRPKHVFKWQHRTFTSTRLLGRSKAKRHHQGFTRQHRPCMFTWISGFIMVWGYSNDYIHQHGLWGHHGPQCSFKEIHPEIETSQVVVWHTLNLST